MGFRDQLEYYKGYVGQPEPPSKEYWKAKLKRVAKLMQKLSDECSFLGFEATVGRCKLFIRSLENAVNEINLAGRLLTLDSFTTQEVVREIKGISQTFDDELSEKNFVFIPSNREPYFEQGSLLGATVAKSFPSAVNDIRDAGNCFASDLYTASVFHLMRAVEYGMRALAIQMRVKTRHSLEYSDWSQLIKAIDEKLVKIAAKPRSKKKTEEWDFYSRAISDCKALLTARNRVSHARESFLEAEALGVFGRAKDLLQNLSTRVSEV